MTKGLIQITFEPTGNINRFGKSRADDRFGSGQGSRARAAKHIKVGIRCQMTARHF
jgi:hypothetical protein